MMFNLHRPGKGETTPTAALHRLGYAELPTDYPYLCTLRTLPHPSPGDPFSPRVPHPSAKSGYMSHHMLVGSLTKAPSVNQQQLQSQSRTQAQTHALPECIDSVALWQVKVPQGQGQMQQTLPQDNQPSLRLCHVFQHSAVGPTCAVPVNGAGFQLMLGDANGGIQLMSAHLTEQEARLVTVRSLPSMMGSSGAYICPPPQADSWLRFSWCIELGALDACRGWHDSSSKLCSELHAECLRRRSLHEIVDQPTIIKSFFPRKIGCMILLQYFRAYSSWHGQYCNS